MTTHSTNTDTWASNIEIGPPTAPVGAVPATFDDKAERTAQLPMATAPARVIIPGVTIDPANVRRAMADEAAAKRGGFSLKPPIYQLGTSVNETGVENFAASRDDFESMALLGDACTKLIDQVNKEERKDLVIDISALKMNNDGCLNVPAQGNFPLSERALEGLAFHTMNTGAKYLMECPPELRATNFNHWFPLGYRVDKRATDKSAEGDMFAAKRVTLRSRNIEGGRGIFSVCGPRYTPFDVNALAEKIYSKVAGKGDARCDVTYDGYKLRFDILFHTDVKPENSVAGEIFKAGILVRTADDGSGSINVSMELHRNLCLNLIILDFSKILVGKRRHSGKDTNIDAKIDEFFATADEKLGYFTKAWSSGNAENVLEKYNLADPRSVFIGLVLNKVVNVPGMDPDEMVARLMRAWEVEGGYNKTSMINAITRAAHSESWNDWETMTELESTAGQLLFQPVWNCIPPKDETIQSVLGNY